MNGSVITSPISRRENGCGPVSNRCSAAGMPTCHVKSTAATLKLHLNSLWSIWYGVSIAAFNGYIALQCAKRYFDYVDLPWLKGTVPSQTELHFCIGLTAFCALLLPFFLLSSVFKVGNLSNDGFKLGAGLSSCSADPTCGLSIQSRNGCHRMWQHCLPIASLFHLIISFCFLIPKLVVEARMIQAGFLPRDNIWKTDLDFLIPHGDPLVMLNFTVPHVNLSSDGQPRTLPLIIAAGSELNIEDNAKIASVSIEFLNYVLALLICAIRYPSVFWKTNKYFGTLFSFQLIVNGVQCLLLHCGVCILYKIHVLGGKDVLPLLNQRLSKWITAFGTPFLLNKEVSLGLYVISTILILISSLVLYLYGYGRLNSFMNREKLRRAIYAKDMYSGNTWGYFTHCAALCVLVAIGVCEAPILYDLTLIYRGSLDTAVVTSILSSIIHLFVWVLLWLILTLKQHWRFKLRVTVGLATVRSSRSIKLLTDVQLASVNGDSASVPFLVVGHGRTYTVPDSASKKAIMTVIQKATLDKKMKPGMNGKTSEESDEQIYWLRPKSRTPRNSPDSTESESRFGWFTKKKMPKKESILEMTALTSHAMQEEGDYVRIRDINGSGNNSQSERSDDTPSEDKKLLECVRNGSVTYASVNKDQLIPCASKQEYQECSPLVTPEPTDLDDLPPPPPDLSDSFDHYPNGYDQSKNKFMRADSGIPNEELSGRSDSEVSGNSHSPPDQPCNASETSSGIHSTSSRESENNTKPSEFGDHFGHDFFQNFPSPQWLRKIRNAPNVNVPQPAPQICGGFRNHIYKPQQRYAIANKTPPISEVVEDNLIINRNGLTKLQQDAIRPLTNADKYSRPTNMKMVSFADKRVLLSSTLPHYPTQPIGDIPFSQCSTMPLPNAAANRCAQVSSSCGGSYNNSHSAISTSGSYMGSTHSTVPNGGYYSDPAHSAISTSGSYMGSTHSTVPNGGYYSDSSHSAIPTCGNFSNSSHSTIPTCGNFNNSSHSTVPTNGNSSGVSRTAIPTSGVYNGYLDTQIPNGSNYAGHPNHPISSSNSRSGSSLSGVPTSVSQVSQARQLFPRNLRDFSAIEARKSLTSSSQHRTFPQIPCQVNANNGK